MSELQVFNNAEFGSVRSLTINGEPYFVGRDVAKILGYANPNDALAKRFKRWVTSEVLPAIRKHGVFAMDDNEAGGN